MLIVLLPHVLAMLIVLFIVPVSWLIKLSLVSLIVLSGLYFLQLHVFQTLHNSVVRIQQDSAGNWQVTSATRDKNKTVPCELSSSSFISPLLIILNFKGDHFFPFYTALITPSSLTGQDFRRLRVHLKTMKKRKAEKYSGKRLLNNIN